MGTSLVAWKSSEYEWPSSLADYDEDVEIWLCISCGWNEEATDEEAIEEHMANLEWIMGRIAGGEIK